MAQTGRCLWRGATRVPRGRHASVRFEGLESGSSYPIVGPCTILFSPFQGGSVKLLLTLAALALLATLLPAGAAEAPRKGVFPYPIHTRTLSNGLNVVVIPMSSNGLCAFWSVVRTGSRDEFEPGHTGFAHFFEHMMFRGTERFPSTVYNAEVTRMGASANAFTSDDLTAYHLAIAAEDLPRVMELESDRFQNLKYAEDAFKTEAGAVYGEYRKN